MAVLNDGFARRVATVLLMGVVAGLLLALVVLGADVLLAGFAGVLIAVLLHACAAPIANLSPLPYRAALTLVVVLFVALLGLGGWLLAPQVAAQVDQLGQKLPEIVTEVEGFLQRYQWGQWLLQQIDGAANSDGALATGTGILAGLSRWASYILIAVFVGLFAAATPHLYQDGIVGLFPPRHRDKIRELISDLGHTLRWFLIGQAITMSIIGVSTAIVLWVFDVPLAITIGLIVGLLGFIPYLGPIIGVIPVVLVASLQGASTLIYVLLAYTAVQLLEGYVAVPLIQKRMVYLPPAFTILLQVLFGVVLGLLGFILATPLAAVVLVLTRFYRRHALGDQEVRSLQPV